MNTTRIEVAKQFSRYPAGRKSADGPYSGEDFRENLLLPAFRRSENVEVELDGVIGYGSSFLEEAFGGAIRALEIDPEEFLRKVSLITNDPSLVQEIEQYIRSAK